MRKPHCIRCGKTRKKQIYKTALKQIFCGSCRKIVRA